MSNKIKKIIYRLMAVGVAGAVALGGAAPVRAEGGESGSESINDAVQAIKMTVEDAIVEDSYYNLLLGGEVFATFAKEFDAQGIIDCIEDHFVFDDMIDAKLTFTPELKVEKLPLEGANPRFDEDVNEVITKLMRGGSEKQVYFTVEGDSLGGIADVFGVEPERLEALNPEVDFEDLQEGVLLVIKPAEPLLTITVEYQEEREKEIEYRKLRKDSEELAPGERVVYQEGEKGFAIAQDRVTKVNGIEASREELSREVIWEAQDEIIIIGVGEAEEAEEEAYEEEYYEEEYSEEETYEEEAYEEEAEETYEVETDEDGYYEVFEDEEETYEEEYQEDYVEEDYEDEDFDEESSEDYEEESLTTASAESVGDSYEEGLRIANFAMQYIGGPYAWGGTSLTNGCDCSGFIYSVYNACGYDVPRFPDASPSAYVVPNSSLQPGDIIVYPHHYALYIGGGQCVEALNYENGICICPLGYSDSYYYGVRIVR